jgi:hypothetical protein
MEFRNYAEKDKLELISFHKICYGSDSYQASEHYLHWLYRDNPFLEQNPACILLFSDDEKIVGCIHTMHLEAKTSEGRFKVHSLQNLIVDEKYRAGMGMLLVKRAMKGADFIVFPGVMESLAKSYRVMKYPEVKSFWGRKILNPTGIIFGLLLEKLSYKRKPLTLYSRKNRMNRSGEILMQTQPDDATLQKLANALIRRDERLGNFSINWSCDSVRWRFFAKDGPFHILFNSKNEDQFCIVSVGLRRNIHVSRFIELGSDCSIAFLNQTLAILKKIGLEMSLCYAGRAEEKEIFKKMGFNVLKDNPTSFVVVKKALNSSFPLTAGITDIGFESFIRADISGG